MPRKYHADDVEEEAAEATPVEGTPEQLTAALRYLAGRIGGAAQVEVDHILGIPPAPTPL